MNTSGAGQPDGLTSLREGSPAPEPSRRSREEEELLVAITAALHAQAATQPTPPKREATDPAERWRQSGGALTGPLAHIDAPDEASGSASAGPCTESRLVARVETAGMGSVCVVVDRSESGMKVWLGMDNSAAVQHASAERGLLVRALEAVGLTVASVSVTRIGDGGISFAQVRDAHDAQIFGASDGSETAEGKPYARSRRRLNLVG
jgi:hypothetical protein